MNKKLRHEIESWDYNYAGGFGVRGQKCIICTKKKNIGDLFQLSKDYYGELLNGFLSSAEVYLVDYVKNTYCIDIKDLVPDYVFKDSFNEKQGVNKKSEPEVKSGENTIKENKEFSVNKEEVQPEVANTIFKSEQVFPILSLAGYDSKDTGVSMNFKGDSFIASHLKDVPLSKVDMKNWYIKDINGTKVVLTSDNRVGFAISPDGSKIKTRGLSLSKEEKENIRNMLLSGINTICNIINRQIKIINISNNGGGLQKSYLVESLEEEGSWDLFLE